MFDWLLSCVLLNVGKTDWCGHRRVCSSPAVSCPRDISWIVWTRPVQTSSRVPSM